MNKSSIISKPFFKQFIIWFIFSFHFSNQILLYSLLLQYQPQTAKTSILKMLTTRKKIQILIYPKIFNVLSFYSKGQYTVHVSVVQEYADGTIHYAMPFIIENSDRKIHESKKPYLKIEKDKKQAFFVTEQFFITYNEESVALHTMALFSFQVDPAMISQTYVDFKLVLNRYKVENQIATNVDPQMSGTVNFNAVKSTNSPVKTRILVDVDKRRVYINNLMDLDQYKRIVFAQCEYFSFLDVYIGSCYLGTRFRLQKYQLTDFHCMSDKEKIDNHMICDNVKNQIKDSDKSMVLVKQAGLSVREFRMRLSSQLYSSYSNVRRKVQTLTKLYDDENVVYEDKNQIKNILDYEINIETGLKSKEQLHKYYKAQTQQELYLEIYKEMVEFDNYITYLWKIYTKILYNMPYKLFSLAIQRNQQKENVIKEKNMIINVKVEHQIRKSEHSNFLKRRKEVIDDMKIYDDDDIHHPFMMLQNYEKKLVGETYQGIQIVSLVVFIHGYQGSDYDLQKAKNFLSVYSPNSYGLMIKSIQDEIDQNIEHLGERVAQQIKAHISGSINNYKRISFVGYSLGGVIAREAVKSLGEYKSKMNLLVTFASPHLGVSMPDNQLVKTGIWYLINFQKVKNLKQLNCEKCVHETQQIFLSKLSQSDSIGWFNKVILVSSQEDNFVPYHSARIDGTIKNESIQTMAQNISNRINRIERVEVWFDVDHDINTFDKMLGRRAHIEFLENRVFLDMFFRLYGSQF